LAFDHAQKDGVVAEYWDLRNNETWDLVRPPQGKSIVGSKWIFKNKIWKTSKGSASIEAPVSRSSNRESCEATTSMSNSRMGGGELSTLGGTFGGSSFVEHLYQDLM